MSNPLPNLSESPVIDHQPHFNLVIYCCQASRHGLAAAVGVLRDAHLPVSLQELAELTRFIETGIANHVGVRDVIPIA